MKNKKSIIAIIAIVLVAVVGVTFAYFQSTAAFENLFNVGIYKVTTTEVFESPDNWAPGQEIPKTITTTNEGTIPAAVRVSYTEQWLDENNNDITSQVANGTVIINLDNTSDWTKEGNYYYYNYILEPQDTTTSFIKSVTLNPNLNGITCTPSNDGSTQTCTSNNPILGGTYKLIITKETVQADRYQDVWNTNVEITEKNVSSVKILSGTKGALQPGDMIGIGETEDFYVLSSDNSENGKTLLLAKYCLLVGYNIESGNEVQIDSSTPGYGLQNEEVTGYDNREINNFSSYGLVNFSNSYYWYDGEWNNPTLLSPYDANGASFSGNPYPYIYDANSNIYPYISGENGYVNKLKEMGAPNSITGRLLSYEEAKSIENVEADNQSILFNGQSYWLGSANEHAGKWLIRSRIDNEFYGSDGNDYSIRPVIEIPTSEIG